MDPINHYVHDGGFQRYVLLCGYWLVKLVVALAVSKGEIYMSKWCWCDTRVYSLSAEYANLWNCLVGENLDGTHTCLNALKHFS